MKVVVSAYACEPGNGLEAGVGWNWVCQAARFDDAWAITREKNRAAIESSPTTESLPRVHWVYYDPPGWTRLKKGKNLADLYEQVLSAKLQGDLRPLRA